MAEELPKILSDAEFDALVEKRREKERLEYSAWDPTVRSAAEPTDGLPESTIEQSFPHIAKKLTAMWPSDACAMYMKGLIVTERDVRQGFPRDVLEDLIMLYAINERVMRGLGLGQTTTPRNPWTDPKPR